MLTIVIPDNIDKVLSSITNDKEKFILTAIEQKIAAGEKVVPPEKLAKEYVDSIEENKSIAEDFKFIDNENWDDY